MTATPAKAPTRPQPLYIVAGTLAQAKATAMDLGLGPNPWARDWTWVREADQLRGLPAVKVAVGYGALERRDWLALRDHLAYMSLVEKAVFVTGGEHVFAPG